MTISIGRVSEIGGQDEVGAAARRDRAQFALEAEMLGGVEGRHLDGGDGLEALRDGMAHDAVHVAFIDQRAGMAVIRAQNEIARIDAALGDRLDLGGDVIPGRAQPQHRAHALADARDGILHARAFMVVGGAARDIAMEGQAEIGRGIVAADRLAGGLRRGDLAQHLRVAWRQRPGNSSSRRGR